MMIPHYDHPVFWHLKDDGALMKCSDCEERFSGDTLLLTQVPSGDNRAVLCEGCVDPHWRSIAKDLGVFPW